MTLREVPTWDALADLYGKVSHDDEAARLVLGEARRREHLEAQRKARNAERAEWLDAAHAQYMAAEAELRGNLVRYGSPVADAWSLWSGSEQYAQANCSEELRLWWLEHPRITVTQYRQQISDGRRVQRDDMEREAATGKAGGDAMIGGIAGHIAGQAVREGMRAASNLSREDRARMNAQQAVQQRAAEMRTGLAVRAPAALVRQREPVDGEKILGYVHTMLGRYASLSPAAQDAVALWALHAHVRDGEGRLAWRATPRLLLMSSQPGSGKSRVLELLALLCPFTFGLDTEPTAAGLAHTLDKEHATALLDEADVLFGSGKRKESVRAVINSGYTRNGTVLRMRGSKAERARVFGPMAIAGLDVLEKATGDSLTALLDRCIIVRMSKAGKGEVHDLDQQAERAGSLLQQALAAWAQDHLIDVVTAAPDMPEGVHGRSAQIWQPLIALGDEISPEWGQRAREACDELAVRGGVSDEAQQDAMSELEDIFGGEE